MDMGGWRWRGQVAGYVTAIRFYKAASEGGTGHTAAIYDYSSGAKLASAMPFNDVGCLGPNYVSVPLTSPLRVSPGTNYMAVIDNLVGTTGRKGGQAGRGQGGRAGRQAGDRQADRQRGGRQAGREAEGRQAGREGAREEASGRHPQAGESTTCLPGCRLVDGLLGGWPLLVVCRWCQRYLAKTEGNFTTARTVGDLTIPAKGSVSGWAGYR